MAAPKKERTPLTPTSFHILLALADGPLHGYGIMQHLACSGMRVGPGTVYGALSRMEQFGWVKEAKLEPSRGPKGQRQRYALTKNGLDVLRTDADRVVKAAALVRKHGLLVNDGS